MSSTETVNLAVSTTEIGSVSDVASAISNKIEEFANKYGVGGQYNKERTKQDLILFLAERNKVGLEELEVSILDDGSVGVGDVITGRRKADLIFKIQYADSRRYV